jgi:hypothetical protein
MYIIIELALLIILWFMHLPIHEASHILVFSHYGIETHLKLERGVYHRMRSFAILVVPNDDDISIDNKAMRFIAMSGGLVSTLFFILCYFVFNSILTIYGNASIMMYILYSIVYTIYETKINWNVINE